MEVGVSCSAGCGEDPSECHEACRPRGEFRAGTSPMVERAGRMNPIWVCQQRRSILLGWFGPARRSREADQRQRDVDSHVSPGGLPVSGGCRRPDMATVVAVRSTTLGSGSRNTGSGQERREMALDPTRGKTIGSVTLAIGMIVAIVGVRFLASNVVVGIVALVLGGVASVIGYLVRDVSQEVEYERDVLD